VSPTRAAGGQDLDASVVAALAGDEAAAATVFRVVQPGLVAYLRRHASVDAADDLAGEVWLAVARGAAGDVHSLDQLRALVFTIARRRALDLRRAERRRRTAPVPVEPVDPAAADAAELAVQHAADDAFTARMLECLTPEQAEVVHLRVVAGLSADAVALVTGRTPGSVRVIQHRALRKLAARLQAESVTD
jgi:RNA polymerase sigma-70 factor (ECF subfamily)